MLATTTTPARTYTKADGTAYVGPQAEQIAQWEADLLSGRVFALAANGHGSRFGYQPPATSRRYAEIMATLARLASRGDRFASVAAALMPTVNLYGTDAQQATALYRAAATLVASPWRDVIGATGPEASRPSAHLHGWTVPQVMAVYLAIREAISESGLGWCADAVARAHGVRVA